MCIYIYIYIHIYTHDTYACVWVYKPGDSFDVRRQSSATAHYE